MRHYFFSLICFVVLGCGKSAQPNVMKTPEMLWKTPLTGGDESLSMNPVLYNNLVIYTANDNGDINKSKLIAFDKETGQKRWEWRNNKEASGYITLSNGYLYQNVLVLPISGRPYQIVAINLDNGSPLWHQTPQEAVNWQMTGLGNSVFYIKGNLDRMKDEIFVADVATGNWQSVYVASNQNAPIFINGMFTYKNNDGKSYLTFLVGKYKDFQFSEGVSTLFKYSIDSNKMVAQKELDYLPKTSQPFLQAVALDQFWLRERPVVSLTESNLEKRTEFLVPPTISTGVGNLAIVGTKLLMTTVNKLVCFDAITGTFLWQEGGNTSGSPSRVLSYDNVIYYTSGGNGNFHAIDATTGNALFNIRSPDEKANGQGIFDTAITLDTVNRRIYTASHLSAICYKMPQ